MIYCSGQKSDTINLKNDITEQTKIPNNSSYLELSGQAMLVSLNYERIFFHGGNFYISGRMGFGLFSFQVTTFSLPLLVNGMYQLSNGFLFELGIGFNPTYTFWPDYQSKWLFSGGTFYESGSFFDPLITGFAGIRIQKKKGFLFRFGFTPLIELTKDMEKRTVYKQFRYEYSFLPWAGMSFGYSF
jgi:hypothetical protein